MKILGLSLLAAVLLAGCAPDRTLETLFPRSSLAVAVVEHPGMVRLALGSGTGDLPWTALNADKPWGAAVLPGSPPGFLLALALADQGPSWSEVQAWARNRGGLNAFREGTYAVLTSPGVSRPTELGLGDRFDLAKVRAEGEPVAVYLDVKNLVAQGGLPPGLATTLATVPGLAPNLAGVFLGAGPKDDGVRVRLVAEWVPGVPVARFLQSAGKPGDWGSWSGFVSGTPGLGVVATIPQVWLSAMGSWLDDPALGRRWATLFPLMGPRVAWRAAPEADGTWSWTAAVESSDPQALRQALKTLVASGDLQRHFQAWALDADTPLIYQDKPTARGVQTQIRFGPGQWWLNYGADRIVLSSRPGDSAAFSLWASGKPSAASWYPQVPPGAFLAFFEALNGTGARGAVKVLANGNLEVQVWASATELKAWESRLPAALLSWLSAKGDSTLPRP